MTDNRIPIHVEMAIAADTQVNTKIIIQQVSINCRSGCQHRYGYRYYHYLLHFILSFLKLNIIQNHRLNIKQV